MTLPTALLLLGLVLLGALMIALARRGRRINRVPACRQCQFDLSSVLPAGVTCPECGAGLRRPHSTRIGQRKRMWLVGLLGAVFVLIPGSLLGTAFILQTTNTSLDRYKPWRVVLWEARNGNARMVEAAAVEIERRQMLNLLTSDQQAEAIEAALDIQADPSRPWTEKLGDLIEQGNVGGLLKPGQYARFVEQSVVLEARTRPSVGTEGPIPISVKVSHTRCGNDSSISGSLTLKSAAIDGRTLTAATVQGTPIDGTWAFSQSGASIGYVNVMGTRLAGMGGSSGGGVGWATLHLPADLAPGRYTLDLEIVFDAYSQNVQQAQNAVASSEPIEPLSATRQFSLPLQVLRESNPVRLIEPTPELDAKMASAVTLMQGGAWFTRRAGNRGYLQLSVQLDKPPHPVAHDVFVRTPDGEWKVGTLNSDPDQDVQGGFFFSGLGPQPTLTYRTVWGEVPRPGGKFDLVLRSNAAIAASTVSLDSVYNGQIVIAGVEAQDMDEQGMTPATGLIGFFRRLIFGG